MTNKIYFYIHCEDESGFYKIKNLLFEELEKDFKLNNIEKLINMELCSKHIIFIKKLNDCEDILWNNISDSFKKKYVYYFPIENVNINLNNKISLNKNINDDYSYFLIVNKITLYNFENFKKLNTSMYNLNEDSYLFYNMLKDFLEENNLKPIFEDDRSIYFKIYFNHEEIKNMIVRNKNLKDLIDISNSEYVKYQKFNDVSDIEFLFKNFTGKREFKYSQFLFSLLRIQNLKIDSRYTKRKETILFNKNFYNKDFIDKVVNYITENPYIRSYNSKCFISENKLKKIKRINNTYAGEENSSNNIENISLKENFNNNIIKVDKIKTIDENKIEIYLTTDKSIGYLESTATKNVLMKSILNIDFVRDFNSGTEGILFEEPPIEILLSENEIREIETKKQQRIEKLKEEEREKEFKRLERQRKKNIKEICSKLNNILIENYNIDESLNDNVLNSIINSINSY